MNNKTFGIIVGVIISLALAMFAGLYLIGLSGAPSSSSFNDGYEYQDDDYETYDEYYYGTDGEVYEDDGAYFYFDEDADPSDNYYEYESLDYQKAPATQ